MGPSVTGIGQGHCTQDCDTTVHVTSTTPRLIADTGIARHLALYHLPGTGGHRTSDTQGDAMRCIRLRVRPDYSGVDLLPAPTR